MVPPPETHLRRLSWPGAATAAVAVVLWGVAGCGGDEPPAGRSAAESPAGDACDWRRSAAAVPARRYVDAVNAEDLDALEEAFAADGVVRDVSRDIEGPEAIREWAGAEVIGGRLRVLGCTRTQRGVRLLVHWAPAGSDGWRADYTFDNAGQDRIARADLQYA